MKGKKIDLIVQEETDRKSKTADGYNKTKRLVLHGEHGVLTVKVNISGEPKAIEKAMKALSLAKLDNQCSVVFSEYENPQTSLDEHLEDED